VSNLETTKIYFSQLCRLESAKSRSWCIWYQKGLDSWFIEQPSPDTKAADGLMGVQPLWTLGENELKILLKQDQSLVEQLLFSLVSFNLFFEPR
jgi:hypothetical protein